MLIALEPAAARVSPESNSIASNSYRANAKWLLKQLYKSRKKIVDYYDYSHPSSSPIYRHRTQPAHRLLCLSRAVFNSLVQFSVDRNFDGDGWIFFTLLTYVECGRVRRFPLFAVLFFYIPRHPTLHLSYIELVPVESEKFNLT